MKKLKRKEKKKKSILLHKRAAAAAESLFLCVIVLLFGSSVWEFFSFVFLNDGHEFCAVHYYVFTGSGTVEREHPINLFFLSGRPVRQVGRLVGVGGARSLLLCVFCL